MNYDKEYIKYRYRYLNTKTGGKFSMLKKQTDLIPVPEYMTNILNNYNTKNLDVLDIGIGNALRAINLAPRFKSYTGLEQDNQFIQEARNNCKLHKSSIKFICKPLEYLETQTSYDMIIFFNSFHFVDPNKSMPILSKLLTSNANIIIDEPKPIPNMSSDKLNKSSSQFDPVLWKDKENKLIKAVDFLNVKAKDYNFKIEYHDISDSSRNLFILQTQHQQNDVV